MSENQTETTAAPAGEKKLSPPSVSTRKPNMTRRTLRKLGRDKRQKKIATDREYAKTLFEGRSKRSNDKKAAFRKKKSKKK